MPVLIAKDIITKLQDLQKDNHLFTSSVSSDLAVIVDEPQRLTRARKTNPNYPIKDLEALFQADKTSISKSGEIELKKGVHINGVDPLTSISVHDDYLRKFINSLVRSIKALKQTALVLVKKLGTLKTKYPALKGSLTRLEEISQGADSKHKIHTINQRLHSLLNPSSFEMIIKNHPNAFNLDGSQVQANPGIQKTFNIEHHSGDKQVVSEDDYCAVMATTIVSETFEQLNKIAKAFELELLKLKTQHPQLGNLIKALALNAS